MITFVLIAALLVAVALAWLLPPFIRRGAGSHARDREQMNLGMLRDQLADLDADLARGTLSPEQYAEGKAELERRVLEETEIRAHGRAAPARGRMITVVLLAVAVPVAATALYASLGDPGAFDLQERTAVHPSYGATSKTERC